MGEDPVELKQRLFEEDQREKAVLEQKQARIMQANRAPVIIGGLAAVVGLILLASGKSSAMLIGLVLVIGGPFLFMVMRRG